MNNIFLVGIEGRSAAPYMHHHHASSLYPLDKYHFMNQIQFFFDRF